MPNIVPPPTIIGRDGSKVAQLYPGFAPSEAGESGEAAALDHAHAVVTRPVTSFGLMQAVGSTVNSGEGGGLSDIGGVLQYDDNWTVEGWMQGYGIAGFVGWVYNEHGQDTPVTGFIYDPAAATPGWYLLDEGSEEGPALPISDSELLHVALVKFGSQYQVFVNGVLEETQTPAGDPTAYNFGFFANGGAVLVDEWRLSNTARYLTGFTPPTEPFTPDQYTVALWHMDDTPVGEWWDTPSDVGFSYAPAVSEDASGNGNSLGVLTALGDPLEITASPSTLGEGSGVGYPVVVTSIGASGVLLRGDIQFLVNNGTGTQPTVTPPTEEGGIGLIDLPVSGLTNPMTTTGDVIYSSDNSGTPARLGIGTSDQVLTVVGGVPAWAAASGGFANPMTTAGDIIVGGAAGAAGRLGIGTSAQVLTVVSGVPAWANASSGFTNPMTTAGDLIYENATPAPARLGIGTTDQVLTVVGGVPAWASPSGGSSAGQFSVGFNGNGAALVAPLVQDVVAPAACTITGWEILSDVSGSCAVDVWLSNYAGYPPTSADDITGGNPPTLTTALKAEDSSLTGWTTAVAAGSILRFTLSSVSGSGRLLLVLSYTT